MRSFQMAQWLRCSCEGKCKIIWSNWGAVPVKEKKALWKLIKAHYVFPSKHEELGKRDTILTIGRALRRFIHALNKFYVQPGVSPLNRFRFITPNEWNVFLLTFLMQLYKRTGSTSLVFNPEGGSNSIMYTTNTGIIPTSKIRLSRGYVKYG
jgi:hypothetical protein